MSLRKKISRKDLLSACAEPGPGDGVDPRLPLREGPQPAAGRKALQLCGQVARTLTGVFAACGDDVLRDLAVEAVTPAPNTSRLLVTVSPAPSAPAADLGAVAERLARAQGMLRSEVATAINRRRAPDLTFRVRG
jgi:ribosome-binding factor A